MIDVERRGSVAVIRMAHGKVNAMDGEFLGALERCLADLEADGVGAVVLTGNERVFSAGADLRQYIDGGAPYVDALLPALTRALVAVLTAPFPVVAAVNGAAIAGGAVLAAACDRRLLAAGARIGAPELVVGVPLPVAAMEILAEACGRDLAEVIWTSGLFEGDEARRVGLVDEVVAPESLADRALAVAEGLAGSLAATTRLTKAHLRARLLARIDEAKSGDDAVRSIWLDRATVAGVAAYLEATVRR